MWQFCWLYAEPYRPKRVIMQEAVLRWIPAHAVRPSCMPCLSSWCVGAFIMRPVTCILIYIWMPPFLQCITPSPGAMYSHQYSSQCRPTCYVTCWPLPGWVFKEGTRLFSMCIKNNKGDLNAILVSRSYVCAGLHWQP